MDMQIPFLAVFFLLVLLIFNLIARYITPPSRTKPPPSTLRLPPGPWQLPLIGSLHHLLLSRFSDLPHRALLEICGGEDIIFSHYNERWRELRKVCVLELFNHRRVLSFRPVREEEVANLLRSVSGECSAAAGDDGGVVDIGEGIRHAINDIAVRTVIGDRCRYQDEYLSELEEAVRLTGGFNLADLYPSSRLVRRFSAAARDMARCQKNMYRIIEMIIQERALAPAPERERDLLDVLLRLQREGGLQFALTNEIISTVIFVRSSLYIPKTTVLGLFKDSTHEILSYIYCFKQSF
ncbi:hypothetical protein HU200_048286 [Digitaria exilis]|uniref:Cytochrome P450 n=1 Tax=Digitaria exilis TaxID=1010633 RepID=A0A835B6U8_9POAL|nr:hypothetical protein HU200_048286 [Digitaria exilis]